jgi:alpha/beta superfamily hydrolase
MISRTVSIPCATIVLEGILEIPEVSDNHVPGAVICHPHPLFGGTMTNNVTKAMTDGLLERGTVCLRFNFRGTGRSQGSYGEGMAEVDDVKAALDFLQRIDEVDPNRIILGGYSFGCWVGLKAASEDRRPQRLIGVSPPVDEYDFSFLKNERRPILLMAGDRDFVCSQEGFKALVESIPEPKVGITLSGADHFHFGREKHLIRETNAFLDRYPWENLP